MSERDCIKQVKWPNQIFASTSDSEIDSMNNIVGVTAHCVCGNVFYDDVIHGKIRRVAIEENCTTKPKELGILCNSCDRNPDLLCKNEPLGRHGKPFKFAHKLFVCYETGVFEFKQGIGAKVHLEKVKIVQVNDNL